jgi:hypothetical protein
MANAPEFKRSIVEDQAGTVRALSIEISAHVEQLVVDHLIGETEANVMRSWSLWLRDVADELVAACAATDPGRLKRAAAHVRHGAKFTSGIVVGSALTFGTTTVLGSQFGDGGDEARAESIYKRCEQIIEFADQHPEVFGDINEDGEWDTSRWGDDEPDQDPEVPNSLDDFIPQREVRVSDADFAEQYRQARGAGEGPDVVEGNGFTIPRSPVPGESEPTVPTTEGGIRFPVTFPARFEDPGDDPGPDPGRDPEAGRTYPRTYPRTYGGSASLGPSSPEAVQRPRVTIKETFPGEDGYEGALPPNLLPPAAVEADAVLDADGRPFTLDEGTLG